MEANSKTHSDRIESLQEEVTRLRGELHDQRRKLDSQLYGGGGPVTRDDAFRWTMYGMTLLTMIAAVVAVTVTIAASG